MALYVGCFFEMLDAHTKGFRFTDIFKLSGKFQLFNMCVSQDILKISLQQISFKFVRSPSSKNVLFASVKAL